MKKIVLFVCLTITASRLHLSCDRSGIKPEDDDSTNIYSHENDSEYSRNEEGTNRYTLKAAA